MATLKFYFHPSPNPMKVALLLEELNVQYDLVPVDTFRGEQHDEEFLRINPNAKVPAILDEGTAVFDSNAILLHLSLTHGRFLPQEESSRAIALSWLLFVASGLSPFLGQAVHFLKMCPEDIPYAKNRYLKEVARHFEVIEQRLASSQFIGGDDYSIVDMAAWGWLKYAHYALDEGLIAYPRVNQLFQTISARPAAQRAASLQARDFGLKQQFDSEVARILFPQNS